MYFSFIRSVRMLPTVQDDLARLHTVPGNIPKEMDSIRRHKLYANQWP